MSGVVWVRFNQDPSEFQIYFKDNIEEIITDYTADSPYECGTCCTKVGLTVAAERGLINCTCLQLAAEIVAKLKYILSRRK